MGTGECAPLTVGVAVVGDQVGAAVVGTAQAQFVGVSASLGLVLQYYSTPIVQAGQSHPG